MRSCRVGERGSYGRDLVAGVRSLNADGKGDGHEKGRTHLFRWRPAFMYLGLYLEVGEVTCVSLPLVMLVREFPFPSTCVFPLRVSALFPIAADPKDPFPSYVGVPAPTKPKFGRGMQCNALSCSLSSAKEIRRGRWKYVTEIGSCQVRRRFF